MRGVGKDLSVKKLGRAAAGEQEVDVPLAKAIGEYLSGDEGENMGRQAWGFRRSSPPTFFGGGGGHAPPPNIF